MAKTTYSPDSVYRKTQIVGNKYLDIYVPEVEYPESYDIIDVVIENKFNQRPDLLAHNLYGNAKLWWVFAEFNQDLLKDPIIDFKSGLKIKAPARFS